MKQLLISVIDRLKATGGSPVKTFALASLVLALLQKLGISPVQEVTLSLLRMLVLHPNMEAKQCNELQNLMPLLDKTKEFRYTSHSNRMIAMYCVEVCW